MAGQALGELWAVEILQYRLATPGTAGDDDDTQVQDVFLLRMWVTAQSFPDPSADDPRLVKWDMTPPVTALPSSTPIPEGAEQPPRAPSIPGRICALILPWR